MTNPFWSIGAIKEFIDKPILVDPGYEGRVGFLRRERILTVLLKCTSLYYRFPCIPSVSSLGMLPDAYLV